MVVSVRPHGSEKEKFAKYGHTCSYNACPTSCTVPATPCNQLSAEYRVVMRTSVGWGPPVKGCTETSSRPLGGDGGRKGGQIFEFKIGVTRIDH
jgi:hypothetical protein